MIKKNVTLSTMEFKTLFEYMMKMYTENGMSTIFSRFIYTNLPTMQAALAKMQNEMMKIEQPVDFDFNNAVNDISQKYCDRDAQGNPIIENDKYRINDMLVEWKEEYAKLKEKKDEYDKKYSEFIAQVNKLTINFDMQVLDMGEVYPQNLPPIILEIIETKLI